MAFDPAQTKSIVTSVTFWGAVLTALAAVFPGLFTKVFGATPTATVAQDVVIGFTTLLTFWGRIRATQPVTITGAPAVPPVKTPGVG
jgi:hypothetical protein